MIATKPGDLSSISGTHIVEGENQPLQAVLWFHTHTQTHKYINTIKMILKWQTQNLNSKEAEIYLSPEEQVAVTVYYSTAVGSHLKHLS